MKKTSREHSIYDGSSTRSESPPPSYSSQPQQSWSRCDEQTPLFAKANPSSTSNESDVPGILTYLIAFSVIALLTVTILAIFVLSGAVVRTPPDALQTPTFSVAIIGAGPAGISAAQHLRRRTAGRNFRLNITLFESSPVIGGNLALNGSTTGPVFPYDDPLQDPIIAEDITGSALLWSNPFFTKASEGILGDKVDFAELPSHKVGYFSGEGIVVETTRPYEKTSWCSWLGLLFRYGFSISRARALLGDGNLQDRFADPPLVPEVSQLMISLGLTDPVQQQALIDLDARGIGGAYVTEILEPQVQRAHPQGITSQNALGMRVAAFQEDTANFYTGGNLIDRLEQVVASTGITVRTATEVSRLKYQQITEDDFAWIMEFSAVGLPGPHYDAFDQVIIAAPSFSLYEVASGAVSVEDVEAASALLYQPAHVTFFIVPSRLNPDIFGNFDQILLLREQHGDNALEGVRELAFVRQVYRVGRWDDGDGDDDDNKAPKYLYRAISDGPVTERLRSLDLGITWIHETEIEHAYPLVYHNTRFPSFKLSEHGLWWTSPIHAIASTIDMSWLAGKIVAEELAKNLTK